LPVQTLLLDRRPGRRLLGDETGVIQSERTDSNEKFILVDSRERGRKRETGLKSIIRCCLWCGQRLRVHDAWVWFASGKLGRFLKDHDLIILPNWEYKNPATWSLPRAKVS